MRRWMPMAAPTGALALSLMLVQPAAARDVIYVPTPQNVVERMLELAEVGPGDVVIDLGSGDGRIAITAVRDFNAERAHGIDIDPDRIEESLANARAAGVEDRVSFEQGDLFEADISEYTVVTMYLLSSINERLKPKLLSELRPGTRVASHDFGMVDWDPDHKERVGSSTVYVWTIPAQIGGQWHVEVEQPDGAQSYVVEIDQSFKSAAGTASNGEHSYPVEHGLVEGEQVSFVLENGEGEMRFEGQVEGDRMTGTVAGPDGQPLQWQAERVD